MLSFASNFERSISPHLAAIYQPLPDGRTVEQIGTGIYFRLSNRVMLVTARHVLFELGHAKEAGDKAIHIGGGLRQIADFAKPEVRFSSQCDIACVEVDEDLAPEIGLSDERLASSGSRPRFITVGGYLARDFKRSISEGRVSPRPFVFSGAAVPMPPGFCGLRYEKNRNRDAKSGKRVMSPIPSGLSGGAMVDSEHLYEGSVRIVGLFTDKPADKGIAYGECSTKIAGFLAALD